MGKIKLTEDKLRSIIRRTLNEIRMSSKDAKAMNDYDDNFAVSSKHTFGRPDDVEYEPFYTNMPSSQEEEDKILDDLFDKNEYDAFNVTGTKAGRYWKTLDDFDKRQASDEYPEDKKYRDMSNDWWDYEDKRWIDQDEDLDKKYNHNVHDDAIKSSGGKRFSRLDAFDDTRKGDKVRKFNGTLDSLTESCVKKVLMEFLNTKFA